MQENTKTASTSIYDLLPVGESNKISTHDLMRLINESSIRELKKRVRTERLNGALILSTTQNGGGYYKPKNESEIADFIELYSRHAKATFAMLKAARHALKGDSES